MLEVFLFNLKYKIKKSESNLPKYLKEFNRLHHHAQNKIIDIYFNTFPNIDISYYFNSTNARYYENGFEITYFNNYYFCEKILNIDPNNLSLIDNFNIPSKEETLIEKVLEKDSQKIDINKLLIYPDSLPHYLSTNIKFMQFITKDNIYNIKYMTPNETTKQKQNILIKDIISKAQMQSYNYNINNFLIKDKTLPEILKNNINFLSYIIENDIDNIKYISNSKINNLTPHEWEILTNAIITYSKNNKSNSIISKLETNIYLTSYLNKNYNFVNYIIEEDINNIEYIDWHNLKESDRTKIINNLTLKLVKEKIDFDYTKYPFNHILRENYMFMAYLIDKDKQNINKILVSDKDEINKLIDIYLNKYRKQKFKLSDYLDNSNHILNCLVENKYMLSYLIKNSNQIFKYIDYLKISNKSEVTEVIIKEISKKDFIFSNEAFLINGKYPVMLSNNYRFMRIVIDKNFNNLAYIDDSEIDEKTLKRIINYAFRMVYYIRGDNKNLNFDIEGYFKFSTIVNNQYFQECLNSLNKI